MFERMARVEDFIRVVTDGIMVSLELPRTWVSFGVTIAAWVCKQGLEKLCK